MHLLPDMWLGLALLGLLAGVISGSLGVGSGALVVPALVIIFHFAQKSAQGTALAVMIPMAILGAIRYKLHPEIEVDMSVVGIVAATGLIGVLAGTEIAAHLPAHILRKAFAVFLLVVAARMLLPSSPPKEPADGPTAIGKAEPVARDFK